MEVREVAPHEQERVGALTVRAYERLPGMPLDHYRATLRDVAARAADATVLVAVEDGEVLGSVTYVDGPHRRSAEFADADAAGIRFLAVDPKAQGRGVGTGLVEACVERARAQGRARVVLHSTPWMSEAMRLYERLGFVREPALDRSPVEAVTLLGFVKQLGTTDTGRR